MKLGADVKQPYFIQPASGAPFAFGALWERWRDPATGEPLESCALITAPASASIAHIHDRMPVIIPAGHHAEWLDPQNEDVDRLDRLLDPAHIGELNSAPGGPAGGQCPQRGARPDRSRRAVAAATDARRSAAMTALATRQRARRSERQLVPRKGSVAPRTRGPASAESGHEHRDASPRKSSA